MTLIAFRILLLWFLRDALIYNEHMWSHEMNKMSVKLSHFHGGKMKNDKKLRASLTERTAVEDVDDEKDSCFNSWTTLQWVKCYEVFQPVDVLMGHSPFLNEDLINWRLNTLGNNFLVVHRRLDCPIRKLFYFVFTWTFGDFGFRHNWRCRLYDSIQWSLHPSTPKQLRDFDSSEFCWKTNATIDRFTLNFLN